MSDSMNINTRKPKAIYEPGELEKTRNNIGLLDPDEAKRMMKTLGGEVGYEKSVPFDEKNIPKRNQGYAKGAAAPAKNASSSSTDWNNAAASVKIPEKPRTPTLPNVQQKEKADMDALMVSYRIKPRLGFFGALISRALNRTDLVTEDFISNILHNYVRQYRTLVTALQKLLDNGPRGYRDFLPQATKQHQKMVWLMSQWDYRAVEDLYRTLAQRPGDVTVTQLIPLVKAFYADLYTIWFLGKKTVSNHIKAVYSEVKQNTQADGEMLQGLTRDAISCALFMFEEVFEGLHPLLIRMCCSAVAPFPDMMRSESSRILTFVGKTKYELLFPEKEDAKPMQEDAQNNAKTQVAEESGMAPLVQQGLSILDTMFPKAGFLDLASMPDIYPYFQPIYQFQDGLNYVHKNNPMQVAVILMRIIEDFFVACRYIPFKQEMAIDYFPNNQSISSLFDEFAEYREVLFDRNYSVMLREYVNHIYANSEYLISQFGKKESSNLFWYAHNQFLPYLRFDLKFIDKPSPDNTLPPLKEQLPAICRFFNTIISRAERAYSVDPETARTTDSIGAQKLWAPYHFPVSNPVSKRLDVLFGGRQSKNATNLNVMKYTASVLAVLDFWLNDKNSPAYARDATQIFRCDATGKPDYNITLVPNVNNLFSDRVKETLKKKSGDEL